MTTPEQLFQIDYFKEHPEPFCRQASAMCPGLFAPTASHLFLKLLVEEGIVRRIFTQNIDTLEAQAGIPQEKLVCAHGSFSDCHCIEPMCQARVRLDDWRAAVDRGEVPRCQAIIGSDEDGNDDSEDGTEAEEEWTEQKKSSC